MSRYWLRCAAPVGNRKVGATIDRLIVNSPYEEPVHYWRYDRETRLFSLVEGRREAGYIVASESSKAFDDPGIFVPIELPDVIRPPSTARLLTRLCWPRAL